MVKIGSIGRQKFRPISIFGGSGIIIFFLRLSKTYFSQVYRQKLDKNFINGVILVKIGHFWLKVVKIGIFWGPK